MSCGTRERTVPALVISLMRNGTWGLEEDERSGGGRSLRKAVRVSQHTVPVSFQQQHRLVHPHLKGHGREKKSVWYLYLCWTKIWVLQLFEWLRHNYVRSWRSLYLQLVCKQHGQGLRLSGAVLWTVHLNVREGREGEGRLVCGWGGVLVFEISFDGPL